MVEQTPDLESWNFFQVGLPPLCHTLIALEYCTSAHLGDAHGFQPKLLSLFLSSGRIIYDTEYSSP